MRDEYNLTPEELKTAFEVEMEAFEIINKKLEGSSIDKEHIKDVMVEIEED